MSEENEIDLTGMVKSFMYSFERPPFGVAAVDGAENKEPFFYSFPSPVQTVTVGINFDSAKAFFPAVRPIKITFPGKYWFDWTYTITGEVENVEIMPSGEYSYKLKSSRHDFSADQGWLARFLRWALRRETGFKDGMVTNEK